MKIEVITDCTGIKQGAIRNVFSNRFATDSVDIIVVKGQSFPTPLTQDDFPLTVRRRFQWLKTNHNNPDVFTTTIQKGYYYSHGLWYFAACVGVAYPLLDMITAMTSSVPVPPGCSEKKSEELSRNAHGYLHLFLALHYATKRTHLFPDLMQSFTG
jgi:hypothetical protein